MSNEKIIFDEKSFKERRKRMCNYKKKSADRKRLLKELLDPQLHWIEEE